MHMNRLPYLRRDELDPAGQTLWDGLVAGRGAMLVGEHGGLVGPFRLLAFVGIVRLYAAMLPPLYNAIGRPDVNLAYAALATVFIWLMLRHRRQPPEFIPTGWLGRGQLLYLVFLWWMVIGNFERAVVSFTSQRLITEGVIFLNATVCTLILLSGLPVQVAVVVMVQRLPGL